MWPLNRPSRGPRVGSTGASKRGGGWLGVIDSEIGVKLCQGVSVIVEFQDFRDIPELV